MIADATPHAPAATAYEPFARPDRPYRQDSVLADATDWDLARVALNERSFAVYSDDPQADEAQRIADLLTAEEARRVDRFLAAGLQDTDRMDAVAAATDLTDDDRSWLLEQLRLAWRRLDCLRDAIDDSGSLMTTTYAASSVDYVRWSRKPQALSPLNGRPGRPTTAG
ncbi:hypothetical protein J5Y04_31300 [Kitasatospora sp. RG8]|uniref:hypothetical protein n=1 Tax=Kitasatospora sp. RG8 TaxID=2820815 RepID=UPI001AE03339|nr:hypothetical protein [Kitasatospora sp. RG8]MBP0453995.1 hypothetical protein [Kitasatospora sp. RG8]